MSGYQSASRNTQPLRGGVRSNPESCLNLPHPEPFRTYPSPKSAQNDEPRSKRGSLNSAEADNHPKIGGSRKRKGSYCEEHQRKQPKIDTIDQQNNTNGNNPVAHWASTQQWPPDFATMSEDKSNLKRPSTESSYSQQYKNGEVPKAHSRAYEQVLAANKVFMNVMSGQALVAEESKKLCGDLQQVTYPELQWTAYPLSKFSQVWELVQSQNEARLFRDITPVLVPSPELLYTCGRQGLEHITEEINVEWTKCKTLGGPQPKPDMTLGIRQSAFDEKELAKLKIHTSFERATVFGDNTYFPFLLVEVKSSNEGLQRADRQNMHSSSMAVNAILKLSSSPIQFNAQILVFSISHDNERVKLYGHFAMVRENGVSFYRYLFDEISLASGGLTGRKKVCDFVQAVYDKFYPKHLQRIRDALAGMPDPTTTSMSIVETQSSEPPPSSLQSQEATQFPKPSTPASKRQKGTQAEQEQEFLKKQIEFFKEQLVEQQKQSKEQLDFLREQLAEQRKQSKV